jgi:hypothetical protein
MPMRPICFHLFTSFTKGGVISPDVLYGATTVASIGYQAHPPNE